MGTIVPQKHTLVRKWQDFSPKRAHSDVSGRVLSGDILLVPACPGKDKPGNVIGFERLNIMLDTEEKGTIPLEAVSI